MPGPESMHSPENEIGEQAAKFLLIMKGLAISAIQLLKEKSLAQQYVAQMRATIKERAAQERVVELQREAVWNKANDPRNKLVEDLVRAGRQEAGLEPKGVNLHKTRTPGIEPLVPVVEVQTPTVERGQELARQQIFYGEFVGRTPEPDTSPPPPAQLSAAELEASQHTKKTQETAEREQALEQSRQQVQALELQQLEQSRGIGD